MSLNTKTTQTSLDRLYTKATQTSLDHLPDTTLSLQDLLDDVERAISRVRAAAEAGYVSRAPKDYMRMQILGQRLGVIPLANDLTPSQMPTQRSSSSEHGK